MTLLIKLALIVLGIVCVVLAPKAEKPLLVAVVRWIGIAAIVIGAIMVLRPVVDFVDDFLSRLFEAK